ncbi:MAG: BrnA antitoxin family protein [Acidobacteriaceae bacterium]|nr:BrnA antitoxin family protein [Acidobacteriaceae bacterium]MBV9765949.1 BrnA antitoxin family protein [Acidobacteriaceae bacterium]
MRTHGSEPSPEDLSESPVLTDEELRRMYRPLKTPVTVRLDADVLAWLRSKGGAYQTRMNELLREIMEHDLRRRR